MEKSKYAEIISSFGDSIRADYPAIQYYPKDALNDMNLKRCSLKAIGLWWMVWSLMHSGKPYGHLTDESGRSLETDLWKYVPIMELEIKPLLDELEKNDVFSRSPKGIPFSRRMIRDHAARLARRDAGRKGGNPELTAKEDYTKTFLDWYAAYPRKVGKKAALRAYQSALKRTDHKTLFDGLKRLCESIVKNETQTEFVPHPSTWLNRDGWEDDYTVSGAKKFSLEKGKGWQ